MILLMSKEDEKNELDTRINKIIIDTSAVIVSVFATIGLVMSQLFAEGGGRFYELLGWSMGLTTPFIVSAIISVLVIAYHRELPFSWLQALRHVSIGGYIFAWYWVIFNVVIWSREWFLKTIGMLLASLILFVVIALIIIGVYKIRAHKRKEPKLDSFFCL